MHPIMLMKLKKCTRKIYSRIFKNTKYKLFGTVLLIIENFINSLSAHLSKNLNKKYKSK